MTKRYSQIPAEINRELSPKARQFFRDLIDGLWMRSRLRPYPLDDMFHAGEVRFVRFNPMNNTELASAGVDGTARIWDASTGQLLLSIRESSGEIRGLEYSPDGKRLLVLTDRSLRVWDAATGHSVLDLHRFEEAAVPLTLSVSSNSGLVVAADSQAIIHWWQAWSGCTGVFKTWCPHCIASLIFLSFVSDTRVVSGDSL